MNYAQIAAAVYQACNSYDPYLPQLSVDMAQAWGRLFEKHKLAPDLLLKAVDRVYGEHGSGYRPLPKDIVDAARAIRREKDAETGPTPDYEALCESKAEDADELSELRRKRISAPISERFQLAGMVNEIAARKSGHA